VAELARARTLTRGARREPPQRAHLDEQTGVLGNRANLEGDFFVTFTATDDPQCSYAWQNKERSGSGLGFELVLLAPLAARLRRKRPGGATR
jgi:hypothetical protein